MRSVLDHIRRQEPESMKLHKNKQMLLKDYYNHYALGGTRLAQFRLYFSCVVRKLIWKLIVHSTLAMKRTIDIIFSFILLITLSPVFLLTALCIKLEDQGSLLYSQTRVGKWGKLFTMYKFRSMCLDAEKKKNEILNRNETGGIIFKIKKDPRITRTGAIIRKLSIDELPQLWNVLKGDMSLVGPRPPVPEEVEQYQYLERKRLNVVPGITCIWQVSGRSNIKFKQQVQMDVEYIENQSIMNDIKLLLKTIPAVLSGKGAY
jgi:exopolysaccharide biosynthesis polyprenyl glycosylphosphotransferase